MSKNADQDRALFSLLYVSRASPSIGPRFGQEVEAIVAHSQDANAVRDVTGILVAHQGWFVQALEGGRENILGLYTKIAEDPRHEQVRVVSLEPIPERRFGRWGMCAGRLPATLVGTAASLTALSAAELMTLLNAASPSAPGPALSAGQALEVLQTLPEQAFDDIVLAARALARAKAAAIWLCDGRRRWFKAAAGLDACPLDVDASFLAQGMDAPTVVWTSGAREEPGAPGFYACAPLQVAGRRVGVLCVVDEGPLSFDAATAEGLGALARSASSRLEAQADEQVAARLLTAATDAIVSSDGDLRINFWNAAAERLFGRPAAAAIGLPLEIIFPERLRAEWRDRLDGVGEDGVLAMPALRADGSEFAAELTLAIWPEGDRNVVGAIIRDDTRRRLEEASLKAAIASAESASAAKSAFLANMSHEIRTPLNGVVGLAGLLADSTLAPREREMAELIRSAGDQLQHLLGDILDITRMEAGAVQVARESFSIGDLATSALKLHAAAAGDKQLALELHLDADLAPKVLGDPGRVQQLVCNLLSNAIKFTEAGSVSLTVSREASSLYRLVVKDTGIGFDPDLKEQIFGRFQQADSSITRKFGGTGLGLAICKQVVELLGGQITCDSRPGQGATFEVSLTLEPAGAAEDQTPAEPASGAVACEPGETRLAVLLADDNATNRRLIELILGALDAEVWSVENGALAVEAYKLRAFDVVLMDMMMPVMDGLAATQAVRRHERMTKQPPTPVLMISANTLAEHMDAASMAGVDRYLSKPITAPQLITAISEALSAPAERLDDAA